MAKLLILAKHFLDLSPGVNYDFVVTAIDEAGNESEPKTISHTLEDVFRDKDILPCRDYGFLVQVRSLLGIGDDQYPTYEMVKDIDFWNMEATWTNFGEDEYQSIRGIEYFSSLETFNPDLHYRGLRNGTIDLSELQYNTSITYLGLHHILIKNPSCFESLLNLVKTEGQGSFLEDPETKKFPASLETFIMGMGGFGSLNGFANLPNLIGFGALASLNDVDLSVLLSSPYLTQISVGNCQNANARNLMSLVPLESLEVIDVTGSGISQSEIDEFKLARPGVSVSGP